jgi:hypothetical protein
MPLPRYWLAEVAGAQAIRDKSSGQTATPIAVSSSRGPSAHACIVLSLVSPVSIEPAAYYVNPWRV